jgi:para-aminobenzoate synthetase component 1
VKIRLTDLQQFKQKALQWASSFDVFCCLDSNQFADKYSKFDFLVAAGVKAEITARAGSAFGDLELFRNQNPGWITGFLTYDLKNETEDLASGNDDGLHFPGLYFFAPEHLVVIKNNEAEIISANSERIFEDIRSQNAPQKGRIDPVTLQSRFSREEYIDTVIKIKEHISRGDIYVTNFCQEFYAENTVIDPLDIFSKLNAISPNPFGAFFKLKDNSP